MHQHTGRDCALALAVGLALSGHAHGQVVISQVYGGGGNSGAPLRSDFIELHNNGSEAVDLSGWSVQYAASAGTTWQRTALSGTIAPGGYYLVKQADGSNTAATPLPAPDASGTIAMSGTSGNVALVRSTAALPGGCPAPALALVDVVGFGTAAACAEGGAGTATLSNSTAALRLEDGCRDTDNNGADFVTGAPAPRNRASAARACAAVARTLSIEDASVGEGDEGSARLEFTVSLTQPAGADGVRFRWSTFDGTATEADGDYVAVREREGVIPGGESRVTLVVDVVGDTREEADETLLLEITDIVGAAAGDTSAVGTIVNDDFPITPISAIQGDAERSPLVGRTVATRGIVTGRKNNGFFIQSRDVDADADPATSEGLFVFTGGAPSADAAVGRLVIVRGTVAEYVPSNDPGQAPLTQLAGAIAVIPQGSQVLPLPAPVELSASFPDPAGGLAQLERLEGMRVRVADFTVTAPTGGFTNEAQATGSSNGILHGTVTGLPRPFREPGIQTPDLPPGGDNPAIPRWDFNPELLTVNTGALGGTPLNLAAGARIEHLTGPLDYGFRRYTVMLDPADTGPVSPGPGLRAAKAPDADAFTVAGYNLERFFEEVDDPGVSDVRLTPDAVNRRMSKASLGVREMLHTPDILALVEVENLSILQRLAARINADAVTAGQPDPQYVALLEEGNDVGGIDVGFLVKTADVGGAPRVRIDAVSQVGKDTRWVEPDGRTGTLNDRPPLALDATVQYSDGRAFPVSIVVVHQRSLIGAEADNAAGERVRAKRQAQAEFLARYLDERQRTTPGVRLVVLGDFNAFEFNDGLVDVMNTVAGTPTPDAQTVVPGDGADLVNPDLVNLGGLEPAQERYSFIFGGNAQTLDHVLVNEELIVSTRHIALDHARINADFPETNRTDANSPSRLADHDPVIAYFVPRRRADIVLTAFAPASTVQAGTVLAFEATLRNDGPEQADEPGVGFEVDAELPGLQAAAPAGWACDAPQVGAGRTRVTCLGEALPVDSVARFSLTANAGAALAGRTLRLAAAASTESLDRNPADNAASASLDVIAAADLGVAIDGPAKHLRAGTVGEYRIALDNYSAQQANLPVLSLWGNAPAARVSLRTPAGWTCAVGPDGSGFRARCTAQTVPASSALAFDLRLTAPPRVGDGQLTVRARIDASAADANPANDEAVHAVRLIGSPK